jgi:abortive infection bacteriophage resistance protein
LNDTNSLRNHLQQLVSKISLKSFETFNDTSKSIFEIGFDSLQAVQLHNELCKIFPSIQLNFIYEYSSIDSMINKLLSKTDQDDPQHYILTENLIDKYIHRMKNESFTMNIIEKKNTKRVFLITGANGSLGSWIILDLLKQNSVAKIFCLFRGQNQNRIIKEFEQRHQTTDIFNKNNNRIVLLHNMQLFDQFLGQNDEIYNQLSNEVTDIIHSAYRMDVSMSHKREVNILFFIF